eukprot:TRINITY_DN4355_c0_g1_i3.p1 TRINITY_DN4355_c0_g1~~TRINITY_DN4355_c0_g1_i3.p1  ORF type:complete len:586 (+),score=140.65 TRINITY_DN4355_c0_g1_i3:48-1760(+)
MCGIVAMLMCKGDAASHRSAVVKAAGRLRHRGPDWSGTHISADGSSFLAHERLSIVDPLGGEQPLYSTTSDWKLALGVNGEIYNHKELSAKHCPDYKFSTASDCEVVIPLFQKFGPAFLNDLIGMFAFVIIDEREQTFLVARDPLGVVPLYIGWSRDGHMWVSSEMKAIHDVCDAGFEEFPPGHYLTGSLKDVVCDTKPDYTKYYDPSWTKTPGTKPLDLMAIRKALELAVQRRLMTDVPYGVLLSGGLDSSLVASIASRYAKKRVEDGGNSDAWWPTLHSFCIGLEGSPDLKAAQTVADFIGTKHHNFLFTVQEGIDALPHVIYHLETADVTTIRASTPMYLLSRRIKAMGVKMVLSGEGADEVFGGYLYFHKAPSSKEFHEETVRKLAALSKYDCLRANKSTMAWGVEPRVPFLDREFLDLAMEVDTEEKMIKNGRIEKWMLRAAFDDKETPYLPQNILWRQKEQFSDGVGYSWIDSLRDHAESKVTDDMLTKASLRFPANTPATKEAYYYREIFDSHFPAPSSIACVPSGPSVACSTPIAAEWDEKWKTMLDPSGRSVGVHEAAYTE